MVILIVEDNPIDQLITKKLLVNLTGITPVVVANGKEALHWLQETHNNKQKLLILLDIKMPVMDGFEFLEELSELTFKANFKPAILMLSSSIDTRDKEKANANALVLEFIEKPLQKEGFIEILKKYNLY